MGWPCRRYMDKDTNQYIKGIERSKGKECLLQKAKTELFIRDMARYGRQVRQSKTINYKRCYSGEPEPLHSVKMTTSTSINFNVFEKIKKGVLPVKEKKGINGKEERNNTK
jgi:hypothetical protein